MKVPAGPVIRENVQHLLQQLPEQFLRVRQRGPRKGVAITENRLVCDDGDENLAEGRVYGVVMHEGGEEVVGGEGAGFGSREFQFYGG